MRISGSRRKEEELRKKEALEERRELEEAAKHEISSEEVVENNVESEDVIEETSMNNPSTSTEPDIEDNNQDLSEETDKSES